MNEMTTAGDVGSGTGSEPMVRYGQANVQRRKKPYKIKKFSEFVSEIYISNKYKIGDS